jgi:hypothetical protein
LNPSDTDVYNPRMHKRSSKPRDVNQLAKLIVDTATGDAPPSPTEPEKNPAAVALGRLGGLKGGKARAKKLSAAKRKEIAKKAAAKRWGKPD